MRFPMLVTFALIAGCIDDGIPPYLDDPVGTYQLALSWTTGTCVTSGPTAGLTFMVKAKSGDGYPVSSGPGFGFARLQEVAGEPTLSVSLGISDPSTGFAMYAIALIADTTPTYAGSGTLEATAPDDSTCSHGFEVIQVKHTR